MPTYEYKSIVREHHPGQAYTSPDDILNAEGANGWQVINVFLYPAVLTSTVFEIFYLEKQSTGP